jgi:DNA-binding transcriptional LysR family regulator
LELRHLRYFVAVAESLHFGDAAARLRIAQPSLSQQIRQLELELQADLLHRTKRRVELTEAGKLFLDEARDILARTDRAAMIARRVSHAGERLRVGVGYCMDQLAVVKAVSIFNRRHRHIRVDLQTCSVPEQAAALRNDRLDVGFVRHPVGDGAVESELVTSEPLVAALPHRHRLAGKSAISLSALADEEFVMTSREQVPVYHDFVLKACREAGFVPNATHETDHFYMLLGFVAAGSGVALVPAFAQRMKLRNVAFAALRPSSPSLQTIVAWRKDNASALLTEFLAIARRVLNQPRQQLAPPLEDDMRVPA